MGEQSGFSMLCRDAHLQSIAGTPGAVSWRGNDKLQPWLRTKLSLISKKSKLAEAIRYALARWEGLSRFLNDGRIEIDSNTVERSIRPLALNRKSALFAGSDGGGDNWAVIATLVENCKLSGVDPYAYLADVLSNIVDGHPNSAIDDLLPRTYAASEPLKAVAWKNAAYLLTYVQDL